MERPSAEWGRASLRGSRDGSVLATTSSVRRSMPTWGDVGGGGGGGGATVDVSSSVAPSSRSSSPRRNLAAKSAVSCVASHRRVEGRSQKASRHAATLARSRLDAAARAAAVSSGSA